MERNKARLVGQGYSLKQGIDYIQTFVFVARFEAIRILLSFVAFNKTILYQFDVKKHNFNWLYKWRNEVRQPPSFEDNEFPYHVFKLKKSLYIFLNKLQELGMTY